jgi:hypothetical protein
MMIDVRQVMPGDPVFDAVARLRYAVYAEEENQCLPGMDHARRVLADEWDASSVVLAALLGDEVIGTLRLTPADALPEGSALYAPFRAAGIPVPRRRQLLVGRLMVAAPHRGGPACQLLFAAGYAAALQRGFEVGLAECSPRNLPLYESIGCRAIAPAYCEPVYGLNVPLALAIRDVRHLKRIGSPLLALAEGARAHRALGRWFNRTPPAAKPLSLRLKAPLEQASLHHAIAVMPASPFAPLAGPQLRRVLRSATVFDLATGAPLLLPDCACTETFLVLDGEVALARADGDAQEPRTLSRGQVFNEASLLLGRHIRARHRAFALTPVRLMTLSAEAFGVLRGSHPALARHVEAGLRWLAARRDGDQSSRRRSGDDPGDGEALAPAA